MTQVILTQAGSFIFSFFRYVGSLTLLFAQTLFTVFTTPLNTYRFLAQAKRVGPGSFLISSLVASFLTPKIS